MKFLNNNNSVVKLFAWSVLFVFTSTNLGLAQPASIQLGAAIKQASSINEITIPETIGNVKEVFTASSNINNSDRPLVVHIQDAHANYAAQQSIYQIISYLNKNHGIKSIAVEGADSKIDPSQIQFFEDNKLNLIAADYLMQQGQLSASEYFAVEKGTDVSVFGVENRNAYIDNIRNFRNTYKAKPVADKFVNDAEGLISLIRGRVITGDLKKVLDKKLAHDNQQLALLDYVTELSRWSSNQLSLDLMNPVNQLQFPNLLRVLNLKEVETKLNTKAVRADAKKLIDVLNKVSLKDRTIVNTLVKDLAVIAKTKKILDFSALTLLNKDARLFFEILSELSLQKDIDLTPYTALMNYAQVLILQKEINATGLFEEIESVETQLISSLTENKNQERLLQLIFSVDLLKRFLTLEASSIDVSRYDARRDDVSPEIILSELQYFKQELGLKKSVKLNANIDEVIDVLILADRFYQVAKLRDEAFVENIIEQMETQKVNKSILVAGGFHSEGLTQLFKEKGISYVVVSPNFEGEYSRDKYLNLISGNDSVLDEIRINVKALDLAKILATSFLDVDKASVQGDALFEALISTAPLLALEDASAEAIQILNRTLAISLLRNGAVNGVTDVELVSVEKVSDYEVKGVFNVTNGSDVVTINTEVTLSGDQIRDVSIDSNGQLEIIDRLTPVKASASSLGGDVVNKDEELGLTEDNVKVIRGLLFDVRRIVDTVEFPESTPASQPALLSDSQAIALIPSTINGLEEILKNRGQESLYNVLGDFLKSAYILQEQIVLVKIGSMEVKLPEGLSSEIEGMINAVEALLEEKWVREASKALTEKGFSIKQLFPGDQLLETLTNPEVLGGLEEGEFPVLLFNGEEPFAYGKFIKGRYQIRTYPKNPGELMGSSLKRAKYRDSLLALSHLYVRYTGHLLQIKDLGRGEDPVSGGAVMFQHLFGEPSHYQPRENVPNQYHAPFKSKSAFANQRLLGERRAYGRLDSRSRLYRGQFHLWFEGEQNERTVVVPRSRIVLGNHADTALRGYSFMVVPHKTWVIPGAGTIAGGIAKHLIRLGIDVVASNRSPNDKAQDMVSNGIPLLIMKDQEVVKEGEAPKFNKDAFDNADIPTIGNLVDFLNHGHVVYGRADGMVEGFDGKPTIPGRGKLTVSVLALEEIMERVTYYTSENPIPVLFQGSNNIHGLGLNNGGYVETGALEVLGLSYDAVNQPDLSDERLQDLYQNKQGMKPGIRKKIKPIFQPSCNTTALLTLFGWLARPEIASQIRQVEADIMLIRRAHDPGSDKSKQTNDGTEIDPHHHGAPDALDFFASLKLDGAIPFLEVNGVKEFKTTATIGHQTKYHIVVSTVKIIDQEGKYVGPDLFRQWLTRHPRAALITNMRKKFKTNQVFDFVMNKLEVIHPMIIPVAVYDQDGASFKIVSLTPQESDTLPNSDATVLMESGFFEAKDIATANMLVDSILGIDNSKVGIEKGLGIPLNQRKHAPVPFGSRHNFKNGQNAEANSLGKLVSFLEPMIKVTEDFLARDVTPTRAAALGEEVDFSVRMRALLAEQPEVLKDVVTAIANGTEAELDASRSAALTEVLDAIPALISGAAIANEADRAEVARQLQAFIATSEVATQPLAEPFAWTNGFVDPNSTRGASLGAAIIAPVSLNEFLTQESRTVRAIIGVLTSTRPLEDSLLNGREEIANTLTAAGFDLTSVEGRIATAVDLESRLEVLEREAVSLARLSEPEGLTVNDLQARGVDFTRTAGESFRDNQTTLQVIDDLDSFQPETSTRIALIQFLLSNGFNFSTNADIANAGQFLIDLADRNFQPIDGASLGGTAVAERETVTDAQIESFLNGIASEVVDVNPIGGLSVDSVLLAAQLAAASTVRPGLSLFVTQYLVDRLTESGVDQAEPAIDLLAAFILANPGTLLESLHGNQKPSLSVNVELASQASLKGIPIKMLNAGHIQVIIEDAPGAAQPILDAINALKVSDAKKDSILSRVVVTRPEASNPSVIQALIQDIATGTFRDVDGVEINLAKKADRLSSVLEIQSPGKELPKHFAILASKAYLPDPSKLRGMQVIALERKNLTDDQWTSAKYFTGAVTFKIAQVGGYDALPVDIKVALDKVQGKSNAFGFNMDVYQLMIQLTAEDEAFEEFAESA